MREGHTSSTQGWTYMYVSDCDSVFGSASSASLGCCGSGFPAERGGKTSRIVDTHSLVSYRSGLRVGAQSGQNRPATGAKERYHGFVRLFSYVSNRNTATSAACRVRGSTCPGESTRQATTAGRAPHATSASVSSVAIELSLCTLACSPPRCPERRAWSMLAVASSGESAAADGARGEGVLGGHEALLLRVHWASFCCSPSSSVWRRGGSIGRAQKLLQRGHALRNVPGCRFGAECKLRPSS